MNGVFYLRISVKSTTGTEFFFFYLESWIFSEKKSKGNYVPWQSSDLVSRFYRVSLSNEFLIMPEGPGIFGNQRDTLRAKKFFRQYYTVGDRLCGWNIGLSRLCECDNEIIHLRRKILQHAFRIYEGIWSSILVDEPGGFGWVQSPRYLSSSK